MGSERALQPRLQRDLTEPEPIPAAGIARAVELMRSGRLFRYGEMGADQNDVALLEQLLDRNDPEIARRSRSVENRQHPRGDETALVCCQVKFHDGIAEVVTTDDCTGGTCHSMSLFSSLFSRV